MPEAPTVTEGTEDHSASPWAVSYARQESPFEEEDDGEVTVRLLTDPWSVWCWGFEPVRRTLELRYPSIRFEPLLGGMFEELPDREERGFEIDPFFTMVQRTTGMPVTARAIHDHEPQSTYPACIHVHAVRLLEPGKEGLYLRRLREGAYLDGLDISDQATARELATDVGIDPEAFDQAMATGEPEREFRERLNWLHQEDLHGYPTLIVTAGGRKTRIQGFQNIAGVLNVVEQLSGARHPARPPPELADILTRDERLATREIAEVLDTSIERAIDRLKEAEDQGMVEAERHPTGDVWRWIGDR